jgi:extracellular factor (EF) 3-hydroxypalmitic acid methyl ester biosynthesis protein
MEYVMEWHLIYRNAEGFAKLVPSSVPNGCSKVSHDETGVNIFLEIRKPENDGKE